MKLPLLLTDQECDDLWSALTVWQRHLNKKENPNTTKAIKQLIAKVKIHKGKFYEQTKR